MKINKCRSTSLLIKQKINIALGKTQQIKQKNTPKISKGSYLTKQRSISMKSLRNNKTLSQKTDSRIIKKLNFFEQTPIKKTSIHINNNIKGQSIQNSRVNSSFQSSLKKSQIKNQNKIKRYQQLIWYDSINRKLKITEKNIHTVGQKQIPQSYIEFSIHSQTSQLLLIKIQQNKLTILSNLCLNYGKFNSSMNKRQKLILVQNNYSMSLKFDGYIFLSNYKKETQPQNEQIFAFILNQIKKLKQDGLKQFSIISKIVKRQFQQKYQLNKESYFFLLIKVQQTIPQKHRVLDTQKLISQKLFCIQKITQTKNLKSTTQQLFNKNKFVNQGFYL